MDECSDLPGQTALARPASRVGRLLRHHLADFAKLEKREQLEETLHVPVVTVQPELIEVIRAGAGGIEPDVLTFALAELRPRRCCNGRVHEPVPLALLPPRDQLDAGSDVPPLVAAAHLQLAALALVEMPEIVGLDQH